MPESRKRQRIPKLNIDDVKTLAASKGFKEVADNKVSAVISFRRENERINVYHTTGTVGTCLDHPKRGKTQLFRRDCTTESLERILENPRTHTGVGYYRKPKPSDSTPKHSVSSPTCGDGEHKARNHDSDDNRSDHQESRRRRL